MSAIIKRPFPWFNDSMIPMSHLYKNTPQNLHVLSLTRSPPTVAAAAAFELHNRRAHFLRSEYSLCLYMLYILLIKSARVVRHSRSATISIPFSAFLIPMFCHHPILPFPFFVLSFSFPLPAKPSHSPVQRTSS